MSTTPDRDRIVEQLLRRVMPADAASTPDCLDAETLAAWADDGLGVQARAAAEAHVAGCARCQALLAVIVRTTPEVVPPLPWWRTSFVRWMAPALVTIGAATLWFLLPHPEPVAPAEDIQLQARADSRPKESEATRVDEAPTSAESHRFPPRARQLHRRRSRRLRLHLLPPLPASRRQRTRAQGTSTGGTWVRTRGADARDGGGGGGG